MNSIKQETSEQIFDSSKIKAIPTTLVICPATLMSHWENEITKYSRMRCFIYHGSSRKKDIPTGGAIRAFGQYCVVLTSYELVRAEHTSDEIKVNHPRKYFIRIISLRIHYFLSNGNVLFLMKLIEYVLINLKQLKHVHLLMLSIVGH
jgi:SNF2 family DNA or RNA helicase